jgi:chorismate mutase
MDDSQYKELKLLRQRIDKIDVELVRLLQERLEVAEEIGRTKAESSQEPLAHPEAKCKKISP